MAVLILADELDPSADSMVTELDRRGTEVFRVDLSWFPQRLELDVELCDGQWAGWLRTPERTVELSALTGAWYRSPTTFGFPDGLSRVERQHALNEARLGVGGVLTALPIMWINPPGRASDAEYKPRQLRAAAQCGLTVPPTMITNSADAVRRFAADRPVVTKMLGAPAILESGGRRVAFTERVTAEHLEDLSGVEHTAHQFQEWVDKTREARVIVVAANVFAVAITAHSESAHVDWRSDYSALSYGPIDVPDGVRSGIHSLMGRLGLVYGALDFAITADGAWHFLEINSGGQYGWLEDAVGIPVTSALADLLTQHADTSTRSLR